MKVKELIAKLQEFDGELDVTIPGMYGCRVITPPSLAIDYLSGEEVLSIDSEMWEA